MERGSILDSLMHLRSFQIISLHPGKKWLLCSAVCMALPTLSYLKRPQEVSGKTSCHVMVDESRVSVEWRRQGTGGNPLVLQPARKGRKTDRNRNISHCRSTQTQILRFKVISIIMLCILYSKQGLG